MGLDISAFSHLHLNRPRGESTLITTKTEPDGVLAHIAYPDHEPQFEGLTEGWYVETSASEAHRFRAGSYSGYSRWRSQLSMLVNGVPSEVVWGDDAKYKGSPFYEQINFADNEGTIGPVVAKKLYEDYCNFLPIAEDVTTWAKRLQYDNACIDEHEYFLLKYKDWMRAFELASQNGLVSFH